MEALMNKAMKMVLTLTAMLAAGCQDSAVAPRSPQVEAPTVVGGGISAALTSDTARFSFVIDPARSITYNLGLGNTIVFPAGSLCDPSSAYGFGQWDKPCTIATSAVTINAKAWVDASNHPHIDFDKHVRFAPSLDPAKWVMLTLSDYDASVNAWLGIMYCNTPNHCYDEAKFDPSLATIKNPLTGQLKRRIKHFSGYSITTGEPCDPSPDNPDCVGGGGDSFMNRTVGGANFSAAGTTTSTRVNAVTRNHVLPDHPTKDAWIGVLGGELRLPQAGVTLIIPPGAVNSSTHFSITSVRGDIVAYEFEPHGTHFNVPLLLVQDLRGTSHRSGDGVIGAYFKDALQLDQGHGRAVVDELLNVSLNNALNEATLPISHFSGYMMASGRDE
jgi:hypothetical protein